MCFHFSADDESSDRKRGRGGRVLKRRGGSVSSGQESSSAESGSESGSSSGTDSSDSEGDGTPKTKKSKSPS